MVGPFAATGVGSSVRVVWAGSGRVAMGELAVRDSLAQVILGEERGYAASMHRDLDARIAAARPPRVFVLEEGATAPATRIWKRVREWYDPLVRQNHRDIPEGSSR